MRALHRLSIAALAFSCAGCQAERVLRVTSTPPHAEVRVDGVRAGVTPIDLEFVHYGKRRVTIELGGYRNISEVIELSPPWYGVFPLDIVSEVLVPVGWRDVHVVHARLEPGGGALFARDLQGVLDRAESLRRAGPEGPQPVRSTRVAGDVTP